MERNSLNKLNYENWFNTFCDLENVLKLFKYEIYKKKFIKTQEKSNNFKHNYIYKCIPRQ